MKYFHMKQALIEALNYLNSFKNMIMRNMSLDLHHGSEFMCMHACMQILYFRVCTCELLRLKLLEN